MARMRMEFVDPRMGPFTSYSISTSGKQLDDNGSTQFELEADRELKRRMELHGMGCGVHFNFEFTTLKSLVAALREQSRQQRNWSVPRATDTRVGNSSLNTRLSRLRQGPTVFQSQKPNVGKPRFSYPACAFSVATLEMRRCWLAVGSLQMARARQHKSSRRFASKVAVAAAVPAD